MSNSKTNANRKDQIGRARKALKRKIKTVDDDIKQEIAQTRFTKRRKESRSAQQKMLLILGSVLVFAGLVVWISLPRKGGVTYALCKTFIELRVEYPPELRLTHARQQGNRMRIWYASHDSFGQKQVQKMDCFFARTASGQIYIEKAEINRGEIDQDDIQRFNMSIPTILSNLPDLTLPRGLPDDLKYFKRTSQ